MPYVRRRSAAVASLAVAVCALLACVSPAAADTDLALLLEAPSGEEAPGATQEFPPSIQAPGGSRGISLDAEQASFQQVLTEEQLREEIDQAVTARLGNIPRPRYIPATDLTPPKGLLLLKQSPRRGDFPFGLALGGYMQLRWFEFARGAATWTDATGETLPITNINTFNINRFLLSFHGYVVDERLVYNFALFGTTNVGIRSGVVPIGLLGWKFSDAATVGGGMTPVPGTREWIDPTQWTIGVDRSMANTFFRPGFSPGALATGSLVDDELHYRAGVWNAIDGGSVGVFRRGTSMAWAGNVWWEPLGPFGLGMGDMEHHAEPVIRLGTSGVYALTAALGIIGPNPEDTIVRLSDGTPLALPGALGPGTQVDRYRYQLATVDAGWKHRGWSVNFEYYFRQLDDFFGTGPFDRSSMFDQGGLGYLSWCFLPRVLEVYGRSSAVTGPYGTGQEYGGGMNWYVNKSRQGRLTLEALYMNRNPAQNILYPYRAGYTGTAIQTQLLLAF